MDHPSLSALSRRLHERPRLLIGNGRRRRAAAALVDDGGCEAINAVLAALATWSGADAVLPHRPMAALRRLGSGPQPAAGAAISVQAAVALLCCASKVAPAGRAVERTFRMLPFVIIRATFDTPRPCRTISAISRTSTAVKAKTYHEKYGQVVWRRGDDIDIDSVDA